MAPKNKVSVTSGPTSYPMTSKERHAAHVAEIATLQATLKREAAERRAAREAKANSDGEPPAPQPGRAGEDDTS